MEGGLNYWAEVIMNPLPPASTSPNEELARYQFRKAASNALSSETAVEEAESSVSVAKPPIKRRPQPKKVQGGC
jgi:hypothetical protein